MCDLKKTAWIYVHSTFPIDIGEYRTMAWRCEQISGRFLLSRFPKKRKACGVIIVYKGYPLLILSLFDGKGSLVIPDGIPLAVYQTIWTTQPASIDYRVYNDL